MSKRSEIRYQCDTCGAVVLVEYSTAVNIVDYPDKWIGLTVSRNSFNPKRAPTLILGDGKTHINLDICISCKKKIFDVIGDEIGEEN